MNRVIAQVFLFFISPQLLLISSLRYLGSLFFTNTIWFFTIFYGSCMVVNLETTGDSSRYLNELLMYHNLSDWNIVIKILTFKFDNTDIYQPLITFFVSRFTDNYNVLFSVFGIVLGYFFSRNILAVTKNYNNKYGTLGVLFILLFAFQIHIGMALNGVRMWTAAHVFMNGLILYNTGFKKRGSLIIGSSVFIHFSFFIPIILFFVFKLAENKLSKYFYLILFLSSFFLTKLDLSTGRVFVSYLPNVFVKNASSYVNEVHEDRVYEKYAVKNENDNKHWSVRAGTYSKRIIVFVIVFLAYFRSNLFRLRSWDKLLLYALTLYSVSNVLSQIPSLGRFLLISQLIILFVGARLLFDNMLLRLKRKYLYALLPLSILSLLFPFRMFLEYPSIWLIAGNPMIVMFSNNSENLYEFLLSY